MSNINFQPEKAILKDVYSWDPQNYSQRILQASKQHQKQQIQHLFFQRKVEELFRQQALPKQQHAF